ncbi:MAG: hypothetical protein M3467_02755 [Actinomycetota bacterium]|nr:hypothetical protein [Actinomycetota bacterium]MDQ3431138.1 hypothetical protein [Actinomycetota bacterium]
MDTPTTSGQRHCPVWCTTQHGIFTGEDDHLHTGPPVQLTAEIAVRLCASTDPDGITDGPYVISDCVELSLTLAQARAIAESLLALSEAAAVKP